MKRPFVASVWREGNWYVSQRLEVDVASQGESEEEALANLKEALELHFEPPQATSWRKVRAASGRRRRHLRSAKKREVHVGTLRRILSQTHIDPDDWNTLRLPHWP